MRRTWTVAELYAELGRMVLAGQGPAPVHVMLGDGLAAPLRRVEPPDLEFQEVILTG